MKPIDERLPLYQKLRDQIAAQIARNAWHPGEAIPTEAELAATHKVAVGTVRKAIDVLVAEGLVERSQGRGTFVRRPNFDSSLFRFFRYQKENGMRRVPESRILQREGLAGPAEVTAALDVPKGSKVIRIFRLRLLDGSPVLAEEIWLPKARFAPILKLTPEEIGPLLYPTYERVCGEVVARAEETLTVEPLDQPTARLLALPPGSPGVVIARLAFGYDGRPLEWRRSRGPAATFRYQIEIR
jgi:GntR family transcriptional regulator